ncbi:hypothetical protein AAHA92_05678 [Salvia divinorum]
MEPSSQTYEAARNGPCEPEDRRKIPVSGRPNVQFKFGNIKKSLSMVANPRNNSMGRSSLWFGDDHDGTDEKKDRAEMILLGNTEHPPEVSNV